MVCVRKGAPVEIADDGLPADPNTCCEFFLRQSAVEDSLTEPELKPVDVAPPSSLPSEAFLDALQDPVCLFDFLPDV